MLNKATLNIPPTATPLNTTLLNTTEPLAKNATTTGDLANNIYFDGEFTPAHWSQSLASGLTALHPKQSNNTQISQLINQLGLALDEGHTCLPLLTKDTPQHPLIASSEHAKKTPTPLVLEHFDGQAHLYFYRQWQQEVQLAAHINRLLQPISSVAINENDLADANTLQQQAITLAARQSFTMITGGPGTGKTFTLVRIVKALQQTQSDATSASASASASASPLRIALAAPTGKAAQRMQSVLDIEFSKAGISQRSVSTAQTIHRLLGLGLQSIAKFNANNPLPYDLIVIDEVSMLDLSLANQLFSAIKQGTRIIILGDANQLAAVDAGAVLADLSLSPHLAPYHVQLQESRRFNADEGIGKLAYAVLHDGVLDDTTLNNPQISQYDIHNMHPKLVYQTVFEPYQTYVSALKTFLATVHSNSSQPDAIPDVEQYAESDINTLFEAFDTYRILCATKHGTFGTRQINQAITQLLQQQLLTQPFAATMGQNDWFTGKAVMLTRNDYSLGLSNGDIGLCLPACGRRTHTKQWQVYFPNRPPINASRLPKQDLDTAFAMTIHKSQGSEFNRIAMFLAEDVTNPSTVEADIENSTNTTDTILNSSSLNSSSLNSSFLNSSSLNTSALNSRELVYTAITRAKTKVDIWVSTANLVLAIKTRSKRYSGLLWRLGHCN